MSDTKPRPRFPAGFNIEEKKAWAGFYARVGKDPLLAAELIAQLDKDVECKHAHLALYMCSKESLRTHQQRLVRNQRIALGVRWLCHALVVVPIQWVLGGVHRGTEIALASVPEPESIKPTVHPVKRVTRIRSAPTENAAFDNQRQHIG